MADSTTNIDTISVSQAGKETTANQVFDAASKAADFGRRASTTTALTWGFYGTQRLYIDGVAVVKASGTIALTASSTRYLSADRAFAVTQVATAFPAAGLALYSIVVGVSTVTSYQDHRDPHHLNRFLYSRFTLAMADANKTLTYEQAMCESMECTGALTALRDVVVPLVPRDWKVFANTSGGFGVQVIGASGTGITIADGMRAIVECDGTNVVRVTPDT
jgi:hypothetical protein